MQNYKDLKVWNKAHLFTLDVYKVLQQFPKEEVFNITSQIKRATVSIPTNIAEGCGRFTQKDLASFLQIALGSSHEVEYLLILSKDLEYLNNQQFESLTKEVSEIKGMLISLIKKVRL